jgi:arsenate reductase-like glutaredoxin family protein
MAIVTIYGVNNSESTREARDYFSDCDGSVRYVDLSCRAMDAMDMQRFLWAFSLSELVDTAGAAYGELAAKRTSVPEGEILAGFSRAPSLMRLPLVLGGGRFAIGDDERAWQRIALGLSSKG